MTSPFRKAERRAVKLRAAIDGPTGSGKTLSALRIARGLVGPSGSIAVIDTEHGTAEKFYADRAGDGGFQTALLTKYQPTDYVKMIEAAEGFDCLIIDSLSHAWSEGVLAMVDAKGGRFDAWKHVTPHHNRLVTALLTFPGHLIVTMRSRMAYEVSKDDKTGKTSVEKLGLKPVQREGLEYEFDLVMDMDQAHRLTVSKSRISELADRSLVEPGELFGEEIAGLISVGIPVATPTPEPTTPEPRAVTAVDVARARYKTLRDQFGQEALDAALAQVGIEGPGLADDAAYKRVGSNLDAGTPEPEAVSGEVVDTGEVITEAQRKRLEAITRELGRDHAWLKAIATEFGRASTTLILASEYDEVERVMRDTAEREAKQEAA